MTSPEVYVRPAQEAIAAEAILFALRDEMEDEWKCMVHIEHAWHPTDKPPPMT